MVDYGNFPVPSARTNVTHALSNLVDQTYYSVWLVAEDMQMPPLQQSSASPVDWQQPFLMPPQMNASILNGSTALGDRVPKYVLLTSLKALKDRQCMSHLAATMPSATATDRMYQGAAALQEQDVS